MSKDKTVGDFLLQEYSSICDAHFKSTETITAFFRHYLLVMSIPLSLMAIAWKSNTGGIAGLLDGRYGLLLSVTLFTVLAAVALIGGGMMAYAANLRFDAVLYARNINRIPLRRLLGQPTCQ